MGSKEVTPEPNGRFKTTCSVTTPTGYKFDYCLDSDEKDCDVSSDIAASAQAMNDLFSCFNEIFSPKNDKQ